MPQLISKGPPPVMINKATNTGEDDLEGFVVLARRKAEISMEEAPPTEQYTNVTSKLNSLFSEDNTESSRRFRAFFQSHTHQKYTFQLRKRDTCNISIQTPSKSSGPVNPPPNRRITKEYNLLMMNSEDRVIDQFIISKMGFYVLLHEFGEKFEINE